MAMPEQFSLRWNDFHSNLSQSFQALLEGEDLVDVTLAAEGQYVHAHKLILSVCSPYFKELFKMNPCDHPIVILKDVAHQELRQLLQFMYRGEVHVRQQELSGFLHSAELLQVKGLTCGRERSESPPPVPEEIKPKAKPVIVEPSNECQQEWVPGGEDTIATEAPPEPNNVCVKEEAARSPLKRLLKNTPSKNSYNVKKKSRQSNNSPTYPENSEYAYDGEPLIDFDNELFHSMVVLPESPKDSGWNIKKCVKCPSCHRFFANRYNLKVHIRDKHDTTEGTLQCDICQKRMRNPSCLRVHMYHHRKQAAYIAQLSTQHAIDTMVKWPNDQVIGCGDVDRLDSMVKWHNDQIAGGEVEAVRIDSMDKWHNDQVGGDVDNVKVPAIAVRRAEGSGGNSEPKDNAPAAAEPKIKMSGNAQAKVSGNTQAKVSGTAQAKSGNAQAKSGNSQAKASGKAQAASGTAQVNASGNDHANVSGNSQIVESEAPVPEFDTETV